MSEDRPSVERLIAAANAKASASRSGVRFRARGRTVRRKPGEMNKTERRYAAFLEAKRVGGHVAWWAFEPVTLRLAEKCRLTPDFLVVDCSGEVFLDDVKGFMEEDAKVKLKWAANLFWWATVRIVREECGSFVAEVVSDAE